MTELDKISNRPYHNTNIIYSDDNGESIILDGCFSRGQLLELAYAMETSDNNPVLYTEEMAAEDDELLANVPVSTGPWRDFMFTLVPEQRQSSKLLACTMYAQVKKLTRETIAAMSDLAAKEHGEKMAVVGIYELDILDEPWAIIA